MGLLGEEAEERKKPNCLPRSWGREGEEKVKLDDDMKQWASNPRRGFRRLDKEAERPSETSSEFSGFFLKKRARWKKRGIEKDRES